MAVAPPTSSLAGADLASAIAIQQAAERTAHFLASGTALFAYDWALTLSDEIRFIWQSHFNVVKMLFLVNRYMTLVVLIILTLGDGEILANSVSVIFASAGVLMSMLFIVWNWMLAIRVHALWGLKPQIKYFVVTCWMASSACTLALNVHAIIWITPRQTAILDLRVCVPGALPDHYYIIWIPGICYETLLFGMAMTKLLALNRRSSAGLGKLLLRDGVLYYTVLTSARVANMVLYMIGDPHTLFVVLFLTIGLGSTMLSRMVLNLRGWSHQAGACEMYSMADLATRRAGGQPGESSGDLRTSQARGKEIYDRGVFVAMDGLRHTSCRSHDAKKAPDRTSGRGVTVKTEIHTLVESSGLPDVVDIEKQPQSASLGPAVHRTKHYEQSTIRFIDDSSLSAVSQTEVESKKNSN